MRIKNSFFVILIIILVFLVVAWLYFDVSKEKTPESEFTENAQIWPETAGWILYKNEKIGIEFRHPLNYKIIERDSEKIDPNESGLVEGKFIKLFFSSFFSDANFVFIAATPNTKIFLESVWDGSLDASSLCDNPLSYSEKRDVCDFINMEDGHRAVIRNSLLAQGGEDVLCFPMLNTEILFNNQSSSDYKGLKFDMLHWGGESGDINNEFINNYNDVSKCDEEQTKEIIQLFSSLSKNIMEEENLSENDTNTIKTVKSILSTFRFLE